MDDDMDRIWTMFDMDDVYGRCIWTLYMDDVNIQGGRMCERIL